MKYLASYNSSNRKHMSVKNKYLGRYYTIGNQSYKSQNYYKPCQVRSSKSIDIDRHPKGHDHFITMMSRKQATLK